MRSRITAYLGRDEQREAGYYLHRGFEFTGAIKFYYRTEKLQRAPRRTMRQCLKEVGADV
jgi:hypothetical protein